MLLKVSRADVLPRDRMVSTNIAYHAGLRMEEES
jgi:hypothetical protein